MEKMSEDDIYALAIVAKEQQEAVKLAIQQLEQERLALERERIKLTSEASKAVSEAVVRSMFKMSEIAFDGMKTAGNNSVQQLEAITKQANVASQRLGESMSDLNSIQWRHFGVWIVSVVLIISALFLAVVLWIPSLDEIKQRKADFERYGIEYRHCISKDGTTKPCVRVMKKECNYGDEGDFCVIDPL